MPVVAPARRGEALAQSKHRLSTSPSKFPWTRPATRPERGVGTSILTRMPNE